MGRSARNDHRQDEGDYGAKSSVHSSLQLRRHHGPPAGRKYGSAILSSAWSIFAGSNDLLDSRHVRHAIHRGRFGGDQPGNRRSGEVHLDLGIEHHHFEYSPVALHAESALARGEDCHD